MTRPRRHAALRHPTSRKAARGNAATPSPGSDRPRSGALTQASAGHRGGAVGPAAVPGIVESAEPGRLRRLPIAPRAGRPAAHALTRTAMRATVAEARAGSADRTAQNELGVAAATTPETAPDSPATPAGVAGVAGVTAMTGMTGAAGVAELATANAPPGLARQARRSAGRPTDSAEPATPAASPAGSSATDPTIRTAAPRADLRRRVSPEAPS